MYVLHVLGHVSMVFGHSEINFDLKIMSLEFKNELLYKLRINTHNHI